ncbi:MAG: class I SAM-dependent methyltransferase, partial [Desulfobacterales bacterium]
MYCFWKSIIAPIFGILKPRVIVEIGSDHGNNTKNLMEYCQKFEGIVHAIDPLPKFDVSKWSEKYKDAAVFHVELSLNALPKINRIDAVLIDGDHNWYTVFHELKLIEKSAKRSKHPFPLILLHDIGWPYGRRDLYYNPDNIPETYRKPYKKLGIKPGEGDLAKLGGLNPHLYNAIYENDLQNGVLTAIEDFLEGSDVDFELIKIPAISGLGILFPVDLGVNNPDFCDFIRSLQVSPAISSLIEQIESARIDSEVTKNETKALKGIAVDQLREQVAKLEQSHTIAENELTQLRSDIETSKESFIEKDRAIADLTNSLVASNQKKEALKGEITQLTSSVEISSRTLIEKDREVAELTNRLTAKGQENAVAQQKIEDLILDI